MDVSNEQKERGIAGKRWKRPVRPREGAVFLLFKERLAVFEMPVGPIKRPTGYAEARPRQRLPIVSVNRPAQCNSNVGGEYVTGCSEQAAI